MVSNNTVGNMDPGINIKARLNNAFNYKT